MTDYGALPRQMLASILEAPNLYQALHKALVALCESQDTIQAMSRTMDTLQDDAQIGTFVKEMAVDETIKRGSGWTVATRTGRGFCGHSMLDAIRLYQTDARE